MPTFSTSETESSGSGRMAERIRPEKTPRQRVQKIWRNVRWAQSFPEETLAMESTEITPNFALRKIALLFETKKYDECATLIRRMNSVTLGNILAEVPLEVLYDSMPHSLSILEALYVKLFDKIDEEFPKEHIRTDLLVKRMVTCFAILAKSTDKNSNVYYPFCRNILRVVSSVEPGLRHQLRQKKKALDKCLKHLGQHGLVDSSGGSLMNLHDSLKLEIEKVENQYKTALQKLDELSLSAKHPMSSSITFGKAPTLVSHQRLMQLSRDEVESRLIKNRTVYNIIEPAITNQYLKKLIHILEKRIEYDKISMFHENELRKSCENLPEDAFMSTTLQHFSQGYAVIIRLLKEVAEEEEAPTEDEAPSSDEDIVSPVTHMDRMKTISNFNGLFTLKTNGGSTGRGFLRTDKKGLRPSIISGPFPFNSKSLNGTTNGYSRPIRHSFSHVNGHSLTNGHSHHHDNKMENLEKEVENLKLELETSRQEIKILQEHEQELTDRLADQVQSQFTTNNQHFEDLNLGENRPTELVRQYGNLYSDARMDAIDALDSIEELGELSLLKEKILFSVVVLSFRDTQQMLHEIKGKLRHVLNLPHPDASQNTVDDITQKMESQLNLYLQHTSHRYDLTVVTQDVCRQIYATLFDYPCLKDCIGLQKYITASVRVAWGLTVQNPPYVIQYDSRKFNPDIHTRFHSSNSTSDGIQTFIWPGLTEGYGGHCVCKAVVIT
ncbi:unnamed protein product [Mytilus edulis]|uniref:Mitochondria-eating protein n=1 Tax=Mytilus edulis TaxID=6550 RepID=A0A8S3TA96_MYTED|nr:unnamed protein product [Mytilus edulis]